MDRNGAFSFEEWQERILPLWVHSTKLLNRSALPWSIWVPKHLPHDVAKLKLIAAPFGNATMFIGFSDFPAIFYVREIQNLAFVFGHDKYVLTDSTGYRDLPEWNTQSIEHGSVPRVKHCHLGLKKTLNFIPSCRAPSIHMRFNVGGHRHATHAAKRQPDVACPYGPKGYAASRLRI